MSDHQNDQDQEEQVPTHAGTHTEHDEDDDDSISDQHFPWHLGKKLLEELTPERFDLEINRAFGRRNRWLLRCDSLENKNEVLYSCELPGVEKEDVDVEVKVEDL